VATSSGPILPRRRLAAALRELREQSGKTLDEVATDLMVSTSKLSRLENAQSVPQRRDVRDLVDYYKVTGQDADRLWQLLDDARQRGWWVQYADAIESEVSGGGLKDHLAYESEATIARVYTIPMVPALLQTEDYAREYYRSTEPGLSGRDVVRLVELRLHRQEALRSRAAETRPLELIAVVHEASLHQRLGSPEIMRDQLVALVERSTEPNIDVRVLPFSAPPLFSSTCAYAIFEFDGVPKHVLRIETHAGFLHLDKDEDIKRWLEQYEALRDAALSPEKSRSLMKSLATTP
jgi:transcriptional regulator with XRE-family HTH domain